MRNLLFSQVLVAHAYNPNYSDGRDYSKPAQGNCSKDPISKKLITEKN
jgi:hypothetical protein